jgi:hypothetical protein
MLIKYNILTYCTLRVVILHGVEGLYCKRPIQCLASFEILTPTPPPLTAQRMCVPPRLWCGGGHTRWVERGRGVSSSEDAIHCSVLYICKYFVLHGYNLRL